jgi:hypothetical protein
MGLMTGNFPPVDPATFMQIPYREQTKTPARHWVDYGFGAPKITAVILRRIDTRGRSATRAAAAQSVDDW